MVKVTKKVKSETEFPKQVNFRGNQYKFLGLYHRILVSSSEYKHLQARGYRVILVGSDKKLAPPTRDKSLKTKKAVYMHHADHSRPAGRGYNV